MPAEMLQWPVCHRYKGDVSHSLNRVETSYHELGLQRRHPTPEESSRLILPIRCRLTVIAQECVNMS